MHLCLTNYSLRAQILLLVYASLLEFLLGSTSRPSLALRLSVLVGLELFVVPFTVCLYKVGFHNEKIKFAMACMVSH